MVSTGQVAVGPMATAWIADCEVHSLLGAIKHIRMPQLPGTWAKGSPALNAMKAAKVR